MAQKAIRPIASVVSPPDDVIEIIRTDAGSTTLARYMGGELSIAPEFTLGSVTYVAADAQSGIPAHMALASHVGDPVSAEAAFQETTDILCSLTGVAASAAELGAFFAWGTHFADFVNPTLRAVVTGADNIQIARFLQVLSCFTRHSLPLAVFDYRHLSSLASGCMPTLLITHPMLPSNAVKFMIATQHAGFGVPQNGQIVGRPYSAVIPGDDLKFDVPDSFIWIDVTPELRPKRLDATELRQIQDKFQSQFLRYRLENWSKIALGDFDLGNLGGSTRDVAATIASVFPESRKLQQRVFELFKPLDQARRLAASVAQPAVVLDAMLILCHEGKNAAHIGEIREMANGILKLRNEGYELSAQKVGAIVKGFGLIADRDNKGYKLTLSSAIKRRIHELGRSTDVPFFRGEFEACEFCEATSPERTQ